MTKELNFFQLFYSKKDSLTKKQLLIGEYIIEHYNEVVFLSCLELANKTNSSDATVIRFANVLGYDGYTHMINSLQEQVSDEITGVNRFHNLHDNTNQSKSYSYSQINALSQSYHKVENNPYIDDLITDIIGCSTLIIIGSESTSFIVEYLNYHLARLGINVETITANSSELFKTFKKINETTIMLSISLPRYTKFQYDITNKFIEIGVKTYSVTDHMNSPYNMLNNKCIILNTKTEDRFNYLSHLSILVFAQQVIHEIMLQDDKSSMEEKFNLMNDYNSQFDIFIKKKF